MIRYLLQIVRSGDADQREQHRQHLLGELGLFFAVGGEDVQIRVQTVHVAAEDEDSTPGAKDRQQRDV